MKKALSLVLCCVMLFAALALSGCSSGGYKGAFEAYMKAQGENDTDAIIDLLPPDFYDFVYADSRDRVREEPTDEAIRNHVEMRYRPIVLTFDMAQPDLREADLKKDFTFDYKIERTHNASSAELKEFNNYAKQYLGFDDKAQDVVLIEYRYTLKFKGEVYRSMDDIRGQGICIKMGGKWYYGDSNGFSYRLWVDREGLNTISSVEWIVDWFKG